MNAINYSNEEFQLSNRAAIIQIEKDPDTFNWRDEGIDICDSAENSKNVNVSQSYSMGLIGVCV